MTHPISQRAFGEEPLTRPRGRVIPILIRLRTNTAMLLFLLPATLIAWPAQGQGPLAPAENSRSEQPVIPPELLAPRRTRPRSITDPRLARFNMATRLLIETELRDAKPSEREHWLQIFAQVDADQVPHLLSARRRALPHSGAMSSQISDSLPKTKQDLAEKRKQTILQERNLRFEQPSELSQPIRQTSSVQQFSPEKEESEKGFLRQTLSRSVAPLALFRGRESSESDNGETDNHVTLSLPILNESANGREAQMASTMAGSSLAEQSPEGILPHRDPRLEPSAYLQGEFSKLIKVLESEVMSKHDESNAEAHSQNRRRNIQLRMLYLMTGKPEQALTAIPGLPVEEQEFWTNLFWAVGREMYPDPSRDIQEQRAVTASILESARRHLEDQARLEVAKACFCHKITNFGNYERFARDEFHAGQPVLLYVEMRNFDSRLSAAGLFHTRLRSRIEIHAGEGQAGELLEAMDLGVTEDTCRSQRTDYFHSYRLEIPRSLPSGRYQIRLQVIDENSGKSAEEWLPLQIL